MKGNIDWKFNRERGKDVHITYIEEHWYNSEPNDSHNITYEVTM